MNKTATLIKIEELEKELRILKSLNYVDDRAKRGAGVYWRIGECGEIESGVDHHSQKSNSHYEMGNYFRHCGPAMLCQEWHKTYGRMLRVFCELKDDENHELPNATGGYSAFFDPLSEAWELSTSRHEQSQMGLIFNTQKYCILFIEWLSENYPNGGTEKADK